jgi:hypothetical protein
MKVWETLIKQRFKMILYWSTSQSCLLLLFWLSFFVFCFSLVLFLYYPWAQAVPVLQASE